MNISLNRFCWRFLQLGSCFEKYGKSFSSHCTEWNWNLSYLLTALLIFRGQLQIIWKLFPLNCMHCCQYTHIFTSISRKERNLPIAWYLGLIVVGWCKTRISPSNSQQALGLRAGDTNTIPFRRFCRFIYNKWAVQLYNCKASKTWIKKLKINCNDALQHSAGRVTLPLNNGGNGVKVQSTWEQLIMSWNLPFWVQKMQFGRLSLLWQAIFFGVWIWSVQVQSYQVDQGLT